MPFSGNTVALVVVETGISQTIAHKWVHRWRTQDEAGLCDRSSLPRTRARTPADTSWKQPWSR
ncbi:leucine zipper domain-containing protein [Streptomyces sp. NPDC093991]|uniref:leucine zipper domain-containing protein n=1 Tax=Streptomyces sp. NPDC093991 TaxID=3155078 RepID=UPI0034287C23